MYIYKNLGVFYILGAFLKNYFFFFLSSLGVRMELLRSQALMTLQVSCFSHSHE